MDRQGHKEETSVAQESEITTILAPYGAFITYVPLRTEVPFRDYVTLPVSALTYEIAPRASIDPIAEAQVAMNAVGDTPTVILMPGRAFDASGTRHGRGGGWYDRFLAEVPKEWFRVGFCYETQFSEMPLVRESWDQSMDAVVVVSSSGVRVYESTRIVGT